MVAGSPVALTGSEPNLKNAGQKNASSGSAHKKSPLLAGLALGVTGAVAIHAGPFFQL